MQLILNNISMLYGTRLLFDGVSLKLSAPQRYAIVGANGTGKSTLLHLLSKTETPSLGEIAVNKEASIAWLKQDQFKYENDLLIEVVLQGKPQLWQALKQKEALLAQEHFDEAAGYQLAELEETINHYGGYTAETLAEKLLVGLGIHEDYIYEPLSSLSGGFKLRVLLAQALFQQPDILLLDEPTNHLDIMTIAWLEHYLKTEFKGLLLFISHDVNFIDNLATIILDIDYGEIRPYSSPYEKFLQEKILVAEQHQQERKGLETKIAHMKKFVDRLGAKASKARQAQSKLKAIAKIELPDLKNSSRIAPHFAFQQTRPSGKQVIEIKALCKSFDRKRVLHDLNLTIQRGEKIVIIGKNGMGKSTLLKIILDQLQADSGHYQWGHEAQRSYFAQDHHETLKTNTTIFEWLCEQASHRTSSDVRKTLGQVLFTQDDAHKNILSLSGGEAARLLLAKVMLQNGNVLLLDEPTNHLDIEAIDALATALQQFAGTVILVSHDRHFVDKIATRVIAMSETGVKDFNGSFAEYLDYYGDDYLSKTWLLSQQ